MFASLVRDHHHALVALAAQIVGASESEEVVQSAWLKAYKNYSSFRGQANVKTWLSRIVINEAKMLVRSRKKESLFSDVLGKDSNSTSLDEYLTPDGRWAKPPAQWHADSPEALLMATDLQECLRELLAAMEVRQRAVLEMRDTNGIPFEEICNNLGVSASNARVLLHRARIQLFKLVDHYQETGEC